MPLPKRKRQKTGKGIDINELRKTERWKRIYTLLSTGQGITADNSFLKMKEEDRYKYVDRLCQMPAPSPFNPMNNFDNAFRKYKENIENDR